PLGLGGLGARSLLPPRRARGAPSILAPASGASGPVGGGGEGVKARARSLSPSTPLPVICRRVPGPVWTTGGRPTLTGKSGDPGPPSPGSLIRGPDLIRDFRGGSRPGRHKVPSVSFPRQPAGPPPRGLGACSR
ncbi:unnamed protein product, partial [Staurois parvus]